MTTIIMKESERFHIHKNRELKDASGKPMKFYRERDYTAELKKRGLERYQEGKYKAPESKKYTGVSEEAHRMINSVSYDRRTGRPNIGDRYIDKLKSMGVREIPRELMNKREGGWR
jgi:hypothetical protein